MSKSSTRPVIRLRGVRHNNLKNFDLDLPLNQLIVITGLSGSGKSSLAFDTLFAEGQRRYIETFSPYARQFLDRMDKPQVDSIEGIPPAIAIEQRNAVRTTRSTVGTMTEICDYMKMLWPNVAQLRCRQCGRPVQKEPPAAIWNELSNQTGEPATEALITFEVPLTDKLSLEECLNLIARQGYQRLLDNGKILRLEEAGSARASRGAKDLSRNSLVVIQDRLRLIPSNRARFIEACEQAYHFGKGKLAIWRVPGSGKPWTARLFSNHLHCAQCDLEYYEPSPALFSFNHPLGACPACRGFGRIISIDYNRVLPDRSKTLAQGVVKPWLTGHGLESQRDLLRMCRHFEIPTNVPFAELPEQWQTLVIQGDPDYGKDEEHEWPRAWYGVKGYFRWLESQAYKMHVRVLLSRYRAYTPCTACQGTRFQPDSLLFRVSIPKTADKETLAVPSPNGHAQEFTLADFYRLPIRDASEFIAALAAPRRLKPNDPLGLVLTEVSSRLRYLNEVGLGYLTLDRPTRSLSGGETERVNLTTCLGTRLVNTLFVLDEPSVGLHPRDTERLVKILQQLRAAGNTVVVVEHEASVMRAAEQIVDLGPGHGATGGQVVFQGTFEEILKSNASLTGKYLSGKTSVDIPKRRVVTPHRSSISRIPGNTSRADGERLVLHEAAPSFGGELQPEATRWLTLSHATLHNLKDVTAEIPLNRLVAVTGVSGSGKTTLVREVLLPALAATLQAGPTGPKPPDEPGTNGGEEGENDSSAASPASAIISGAQHLGRAILVDQSTLGKTPRSNPAVYIGAFDDIREFFAQSELAKRRGLNASAFSFNSAQGQCERCRGAGFEKIEMQFLSDVFIRCADCYGRRYRAHILEVKVSPESPNSKGAPERKGGLREASIADLLDATVDEAIEFLNLFPSMRSAKRAVSSLQLLQEVGLGYLTLGQPINTLSGGESQRLKLVKHLAECPVEEENQRSKTSPSATRGTATDLRNGSHPSAVQTSTPRTLFLFDEPTTGLHFDDVRILLRVFQRLVNSGHSVVVIEHNLDVMKSADWIIDLGPDAGDQGGKIVAEGTPETLAREAGSHTGKALREVLPATRTLEENHQRSQRV